MTHDELLEEITAYERRTCNSAQDDSTCVSLHPLAKSLRAVVEYIKPNDWDFTDERYNKLEIFKIIERELA
jgi:hypothetical protein